MDSKRSKSKEVILLLIATSYIQTNHAINHTFNNCTQKPIADFHSTDSLELIQHPDELIDAISEASNIPTSLNCTSHQTNSIMNQFYTSVIAQYSRLKQFQSFNTAVSTIAYQTAHTNILNISFWNTVFDVYFMNENKYIHTGNEFYSFLQMMPKRIAPDINLFNIILYGINTNRIIIGLGNTKQITHFLIHALMPIYHIVPNLETYQILQDSFSEINNVTRSNQGILSLIDQYSSTSDAALHFVDLMTDYVDKNGYDAYFFNVYRASFEHLGTLTRLPNFVKMCLFSFLASNDIGIISEGQIYFMMAMLIKTLQNENINEYLKWNDILRKRIMLTNDWTLRKQQITFEIIAAVCQNKEFGRNEITDNIITDFVHETFNSSHFVADLTTFDIETDMLLIIWYLKVHGLGHGASTPVTLSILCNEDVRDFIINTVLHNVPVTANVNLGFSCWEIIYNIVDYARFVSDQIDQNIFRGLQHINDIVMVIKYSNLFKSKTLLTNYLMTLAKDSRVDWNDFMLSVLWYDVTYPATSEKCLILEQAYKYHNKSFLIPKVFNLQTEYLLTTSNSEIFVCGQRLAMKAMVIDLLKGTDMAAYILWINRATERIETDQIPFISEYNKQQVRKTQYGLIMLANMYISEWNMRDNYQVYAIEFRVDTVDCIVPGQAMCKQYDLRYFNGINDRFEILLKLNNYILKVNQGRNLKVVFICNNAVKNYLLQILRRRRQQSQHVSVAEKDGYWKVSCHSTYLHQRLDIMFKRHSGVSLIIKFHQIVEIIFS